MKSLMEKLIELEKRKDVSRFCQDLCQEHQQGKLQGKDVVWEFVNDIFNKLMHEKLGRRYNTSKKFLYEMITLWGGHGLHSFIILNLDGSSISTNLRQVRKSLAYFPGEHEHIFYAFRKFHAYYKARHGIDGPIHVFLAEDEIVVKKYVGWVEKSDA